MLFNYLIIWLIVVVVAVVVAVAGVCVASSTKDSRLARRASARRAAQEHKDPDRIKVLINYLQYYHFVIVVVVVVPSLSYNIISYYRIITSNTYCKGNDHLWGLIINDYKEITDYKEMEWLNRQAIIDSVWLRWEEEEEAWERVGEMGGGGGWEDLPSFLLIFRLTHATLLFYFSLKASARRCDWMTSERGSSAGRHRFRRHSDWTSSKLLFRLEGFQSGRLYQWLIESQLITQMKLREW